MTEPPASLDEKTAADFARPVLERQLARLERLADIGMEIAEALGRRTAEDETLDPAAVTLAFGRVSRAVRMTCALQTEVIDKLRGVGRIEAYEAESATEVAAREAAKAAAELRLRARKLQIAEGVAEAIDAAHGEDESGENHERCVREAKERLRDTDDLGDILSRPVDEVITQICRELGIALTSPSPWMGEGSRVGVAPCKTGAASKEMTEKPSSACSPQAEPLPPPIPALSPIQGDREAEARSSQRGESEIPRFHQQAPEPYQPPPDPDALPGYAVGLPGELPPERPRRPPYWQS